MAGYSQYGGNPYGGGDEGAYGNPYGSSGAGGYSGSNPYAGENQYGATSNLDPTRTTTNQSSIYQASSNYSRPAAATPGGQAPPLPPPPQYGHVQNQGYGAQPGAQQDQGDAFSRAVPPMNTSDFLSRVDGVKAEISQLTQNISEIATVHSKLLSSQDTSSTAQLEHLSSQTQILNTRIKDSIRFLKADQLKSGSNPTKDSQIRNLEASFKAQLESYRNEEKQYSDRYKAQIKRQYMIVRPEATEAEVREAVDADWSNENVFQTALQSNRTGAARSALGAVRARHNDIQKIERTIMELNTLFEQLAEQVVLQDAAVTNVEGQTQRTYEDLTQGNQQLDRGVEHARRARKLKWWCFFICLAIIAILALVLGLYFGLKTASNKATN